MIKMLVVATLLGGNMAFASISGDSSQSQDFALISSWTAHLNYYYPDLHLEVGADTTIEDLERLESILSGRSSSDLPLATLACTRAVCGGGGTGKCTTCD